MMMADTPCLPRPVPAMPPQMGANWHLCPHLELTLKIFSPAPPGWELLRLETVLQLCTVSLNQRRCVGGVEK